MRNGSLDGPSMAVTRKETQGIVIEARNHIELALSAIGYRKRHSIGVFGPIGLSIKVHRPMDAHLFRRRTTVSSTEPVTHVRWRTAPRGSSGLTNDWSSYCWMYRAPKGGVLTVDGLGSCSASGM